MNDEEQLIIERDYWEERATQLAVLVGDYFDLDVGEHTSSNCPVLSAIEIMEWQNE